MSENQNPPTAKAGIRASMTKEQALAEHEDKKGIPAHAAPKEPARVADSVNKTSPEGTINNPSEAKPQDWQVRTKPEGHGWSGVDPTAGLEDLTAEARAFLKESVAAYRAMLVGMRTRVKLELEMGFGGSLNPQGMQAEAEDRYRVIRLAIARANTLLLELGETKQEESLLVEP